MSGNILETRVTVRGKQVLKLIKMKKKVIMVTVMVVMKLRPLSRP